MIFKGDCIKPLAFILLINMIHLFSIQPARAEATPIRLSLAISGGASMGAYEAGLIWGIIGVLRQVNEPFEDWPGGTLRPIELASIAGTSAGGINSFLAALAWAVNPEDNGGFPNRIDDNIFRDVWLTPDVNRLLPSDADSTQYLPDDALLSRKDLVAAARELREKWNRPGTLRPGLRLPIGVTATRVRPDKMAVSGVEVSNQRFYLPFEMRTQADGSASFYFDSNDYPSLNDPAMLLLPWPADGARFSISDQQIEDILMTTSAFPIGFGRKRLQYCRKTALASHAQPSPPAKLQSNAADDQAWQCADGYELVEAEFADGGLFDNLPIGLARLLSEFGNRQEADPLPVTYIYLDPDRLRYQLPAVQEQGACDGPTPPAACSEMTFNLAAEAVVLGGAIGTARKYELYRELTSTTWRSNLSQLSRDIADIIDANHPDWRCDDRLPFFDRQLKCSDRLRHAGRLLELSCAYHPVPVIPPFSSRALQQAKIATACRPLATSTMMDPVAHCKIDRQGLRKQLADALMQSSAAMATANASLKNDVRRSAMAPKSDRSLRVTSRGGPITGLLLDSFGAFLDFKFREFDYYVGIYDAIVMIAGNECARLFSFEGQQNQFSTCRDRLSEQFYHRMGIADNLKARYIFARMANQEFAHTGGLRYAYDPMPMVDRDSRIIYDGLNQSVMATHLRPDASRDLISIEREFFEYLKAENFEPTPQQGDGESLLALIMDDPAYWSNELINRATSRLVHLENRADAIYRAREPDPQKRNSANTALMGAGALALRTAAYKYPTFAFSPSTAPETWFWRNIIPYEAAFDFIEGDIQIFWQPTWNFGSINAGLRMGLGFAGGVVRSSGDEGRNNYGYLGVDLTRLTDNSIFSGWGITPALFHNWQKPEHSDQTSFGLDVHVYGLKNRLRISLGARDLLNDADDSLLLTVGLADLPGLVYWLGR